MSKFHELLTKTLMSVNVIDDESNETKPTFYLNSEDLEEYVLGLEKERDQLQTKLQDVVGLLQHYQPAGSPPPGDEYVLAQWILGEAEKEHDQLRAELEVTIKSHQKVNSELAQWETLFDVFVADELESTRQNALMNLDVAGMAEDDMKQALGKPEVCSTCGKVNNRICSNLWHCTKADNTEGGDA